MENFNKPTEERFPKEPSFFEKLSQSVILKVIFIFFLTLVLLIPLEMVNDLIRERKDRGSSVSREIAMKWGTDQVILGPVLAVPYDAIEEKIESLPDGKSRTIQTKVTHYAFLMPNEVKVDGDVKPEVKKRGIYQSILYSTKVDLKGNFSGFDLEKLPVDQANLKWKESKLIVGIEDFKGLSKNPVITWGGKPYELSKNNQEVRLFRENLTVTVPLEGPESVKQAFSLPLELRGSKSLNFLPLAKQTQIKVKGDWSNPSFNGNFLPEKREVGQTFDALWNIPAFTRKVPQQWTGFPSIIFKFQGLELNSEDRMMSTSEEAYMQSQAAANAVASGSNENIETSNDLDLVQINFLPSVNNYQKITRVAKYGILVVGLTFVSLIFMELIKKQKVHVVQYVLIGFGMVLFYGLLLAISEHLGFNWAYLVSALATMILISTYIMGITKNRKSSMLFGVILSIFYVFIYVLLQLQDYSLIVGMIGLFVILAVLMRLSTKIEWNLSERK